MKRYIKLSLLLLTTTQIFSTNIIASTPKYIFLFIGDGMGNQHVAATEAFKKTTQNKPLSFTSLPVKGEIKTYCADKPITDSAAAGTALACGSKANYHTLCITPEGTNLTSLAKDAKEAGMRVGITTSVMLNHATPAAFYAVAESRHFYDDIAKQLPASNFDFYAAGGISLKKAKQEDIYKLYRDAGYSIAFGKKGLSQLKPGTQAIALHKSKHKDALPRIIESSKTGGPKHITLQDITRKAIELLLNPNGFFLMVEGGAIDWASHANAGGTMIHETLDFDSAVETAIDFYKSHPEETLIIVTSDHETGGLQYNQESNISLLTTQNGSDAQLKRIVSTAMKKNVKFPSLIKSIESFFGQKFTSEESTQLQNTFNKLKAQEVESEKKSMYGKTHTLAAQAIKLINKRAGLTWTSNGHTSDNVPVYAIGPGSELFEGEHDNTYIGLTLKYLIKTP